MITYHKTNQSKKEKHNLKSKKDMKNRKFNKKITKTKNNHYIRNWTQINHKNLVKYNQVNSKKHSNKKSQFKNKTNHLIIYLMLESNKIKMLIILNHPINLVLMKNQKKKANTWLTKKMISFNHSNKVSRTKKEIKK